MFAHLLFAQAIGAQYNLDANGAVLVAVSVVATLSIAGAGALILAAFRRKPSPDKEVSDEIAEAISALEVRVEKRMSDMVAEVHRLNAERRTTIAGLFTKFDELRTDTDDRLRIQATTMSKGFEDLHRSLGRIEGKVG
ncbi:MAG TPA: hypothetical protein VIM61_00635 [Chthoniobacterales bacterium]